MLKRYEISTKPIILQNLLKMNEVLFFFAHCDEFFLFMRFFFSFFFFGSGSKKTDKMSRSGI